MCVCGLAVVGKFAELGAAVDTCSLRASSANFSLQLIPVTISVYGFAQYKNSAEDKSVACPFFSFFSLSALSSLRDSRSTRKKEVRDTNSVSLFFPFPLFSFLFLPRDNDIYV